MGRARNWLRRRLRQWLFDDSDTKHRHSLELVVDGKVIRAEARETAGLHLLCVSKSLPDPVLASVATACNEERFWEVWRRLNKGTPRWEDGTPCDPENDLL